MKTITIQIKVSVPEGCDRVAVNEKGLVMGFSENCNPKPLESAKDWWYTKGFYRPLRVENWKETLTDVNEEEPLYSGNAQCNDCKVVFPLSEVFVSNIFIDDEKHFTVLCRSCRDKALKLIESGYAKEESNETKKME